MLVILEHSPDKLHGQTSPSKCLSGTLMNELQVPPSRLSEAEPVSENENTSGRSGKYRKVKTTLCWRLKQVNNSDIFQNNQSYNVARYCVLCICACT